MPNTGCHKLLGAANVGKAQPSKWYYYTGDLEVAVHKGKLGRKDEKQGWTNPNSQVFSWWAAAAIAAAMVVAVDIQNTLRC